MTNALISNVWLTTESDCACAYIYWPTGHFSLATLQRHGYLHSLITQNVDRLHQAAGSREVLELHGTIHEVRKRAGHGYTTGVSAGQAKHVTRLYRHASCATLIVTHAVRLWWALSVTATSVFTASQARLYKSPPILGAPGWLQVDCLSCNAWTTSRADLQARLQADNAAWLEVRAHQVLRCFVHASRMCCG